VRVSGGVSLRVRAWGTYSDARIGDEISKRVTNGKDRETDDGIRKPKDEPKCLEKQRCVSAHSIQRGLEIVTWRTFTTSSAITMIHMTETRNPMEHLAI